MLRRQDGAESGAMRLVCGQKSVPEVEGDLQVGTAVGAALVFSLVILLVLFNIRVAPLGSAGALLCGAGLMVAVVLGPDLAYRTIGDDGNLRFLLLTLGMMVFAQYFQREQYFSKIVKLIIRRDCSFYTCLCRLTLATFLISGLFSIDTVCVVFTPLILQILRGQKFSATELETFVLGIATSANIGSVLTVYGSSTVAAIAAKSARSPSKNRLDMISCCVYLSLTAVVSFVLNTTMLIIYHKLKPKLQKEASRESVIELEGVEESLITPNAILDHIIEEEKGLPSITLTHAASDNCVSTPKSDKKNNTGPKKGVGFMDSPRLPKFSVGDINAKGVQGQGPPSLYVGPRGVAEDLEDETELNKDQCHSLYNLDKIGYIAVSERHGQDETGMPRTISFYHSFSDLDSWQYTRDSVVHRYEHDQPHRPPLSALQRRRASSRGRLETVNFKTTLSHKRPRQRRTSVFYMGLRSDSVLVLPKLGVYRAFSGLSPSIQFLTGRRQDVEYVQNIVHREFVPSRSRFFRVFLLVSLAVNLGLFFIRIPQLNADIGMIPLGTGAVVMLVDAVWNRRNGSLLLRRLNWAVVLNYFALFIFVRGLTASSLPLWIWSKMNFVSMYMGDAVSLVVLTCIVLLFSQTLGGLTLVLVLMELPVCGERRPQLIYLAWCSMVAANCTLHGSASTLQVVQKAGEVLQVEVTFWRYLRYSLPSSLVILLAGLGLLAGLLHAVRLSGGLDID